MAKKKRGTEPLIADHQNVHNAPEGYLEAIVVDWLRDGGDWFSFNEVWTRRSELKKIAKRHGLYFFQEVPGRRTGLVEEAGSTAVFLNKKTIKVGTTRVVGHKLRWFVYSARRWHTGRRDVVVRFKSRVDGQKYAGRAFHFPTNGFDGGNRAAFREQLASFGKFLRRTRKRVKKFGIGDGNEMLAFFKDWADDFGGRAAGHRIDLVVAVNARVSVKTLAKGPADHHRIRATIR